MCLDIIKNTLWSLEQPISFDFDPEVILYGEKEYIALGVCQKELVLRTEQ